MKVLNERQNEIIEKINHLGFISVQELSDFFGVSVVTIRKDLSFLEEEGYLFRTHGGATKQKRYAFEQSVLEKEKIYVEEKTRIGLKATEFIQENDFIIIGSGTTMHYLARNINQNSRFTALTHSLRVALELSKLELVNVIQLGGELRKSSSSVVGAISEEILKKFSCNKLFLGVDGIDLEFGISTSNAAEAHLNQLMVSQAQSVIILADSSKINKKGFGKICDLDKIQTLITDNKIDQNFISKLEEIGIEVIIV